MRFAVPHSGVVTHTFVAWPLQTSSKLSTLSQANIVSSNDNLGWAAAVADRFELPEWTRVHQKQLHSLQVISMLLCLSTRQVKIETLFEHYSCGPEMSLSDYHEFVLAEQVRKRTIAYHAPS